MKRAAVRAGMMLAAVPPSMHDAVDARLRPQLLAPQPDGAEEQDQRVEGVATLPGIGRGVGLEAREGDLDVLAGERRCVSTWLRSQGW